MQLVAREYNAPELFVYFSVAEPKGFGNYAVLPRCATGGTSFSTRAAAISARLKI